MRKTKINQPSQQMKPDHTSIEFKNCSYVYSPKTPYEFNALNDVSLKFINHKITAVIGSTGSGKSTLIQHINGLLIPTKGEVQVFDFNINAKTKKIKNIRDLRKKIGLVFQFPEYQLFEETVSKDIMFGVRQLNNESFFQKEHDYLYYGLGGRENIVNYKFEGVQQLKVTCHNLANIAKDQLQKTSMQNIIN